MPDMIIHLDDDDELAIHEAIALRQSLRVNNENIMPDGTSDLRGALIAEICRSWIEIVQSWESQA